MNDLQIEMKSNDILTQNSHVTSEESGCQCWDMW